MADAIALKTFQPSDFLSQLLGGNVTTQRTVSDANIGPATQVFSQMGPLSPADMDALIASITTSAAQKVPELTAALANAAGTRTRGNSPLALALQQTQLQARNEAMRQIGEQNIQRGQVQAKAAGDIAQATRGQTTKTQQGANPVEQLLAGFLLNKADKKGWLDWAKTAGTPAGPNAVNLPTAPAPVAAGPQGFEYGPPAPEVPGYEYGPSAADITPQGWEYGPSAADFGASEMPQGYEYGPSAADFAAGTSAGAAADVGAGAMDYGMGEVPLEDVSSFDWGSFFADGGSTSVAPMDLADQRRRAHILMQDRPGMTMEEATRQIIAETLGQSVAIPPAPVSPGYTSGPVPFEKPDKPTQQVAPAAPTREVLQQGNRPTISQPNLVEQLINLLSTRGVGGAGGTQGFADGGSMLASDTAKGAPETPIIRNRNYLGMPIARPRSLAASAGRQVDTSELTTLAQRQGKVREQGVNDRGMETGESAGAPAAPAAPGTFSFSPSPMGALSIANAAIHSNPIAALTSFMTQYAIQNMFAPSQQIAQNEFMGPVAPTTEAPTDFGFMGPPAPDTAAMDAAAAAAATSDTGAVAGTADSAAGAGDATAGGGDSSAGAGDSAAGGGDSSWSNGGDLKSHFKVNRAPRPVDRERRGELLADGGFASTGLVRGPGTGTSDSISTTSRVPGAPKISLSNQEYIIPADVVDRVGVSFFDKLLSAYHMPVRR